MFVFFVIFEEMDKKKKNLIITLKSLLGKTSE